MTTLTRRFLKAVAFAVLSGASLGAAARFLSVDPVQANPQTGGNFNRYSYGNNNPYKYVDPDGRYVCDSSASNCAQLDQALVTANKLSSSNRLSLSEQGMLREVVDFYGHKGDPSVVVTFRKPDLVQGTATLNKDMTSKISVGESRDPWLLTRNVFHEGSHGRDDRDRKRPIESYAERKATEIRAYTIQAIYQKATHRAASSNDGWTISHGFRPERIERQAEGSIRASCGVETGGSCAP